MRVFTPILLISLVLYIAAFNFQEKVFKDTPDELTILPSSSVIRVASGYLYQVIAEAAFIESAIFLGGVKSGTDPGLYLPSLANNYLQITTLYPEFQDPYYFAQSSLAHVAPEFARAANTILVNGRKAYPENLIFPFFQAYNHFRYLDEPLEAADIFREASLLPEAPPMFAHLAVTLKAKGGKLEAAIISLVALIKGAESKEERERYQLELEVFEKALSIQRTVALFYRDKKFYPQSIDELVPDYLNAIPEIDPMFRLIWKPPEIGVTLNSP